MSNVKVQLMCALIMLSPLFVNTETNASGLIEVRHPFNTDNPLYQQRDEYFLTLLQLALTLAEQEFKLVTLPVPTMPEERSMKLINDGYYNVHWMGTNVERESQLLPVKIPLEKGLIGWRLILIHSANKNRFANISKLSELKRLTAGLGHDWPDTKIFRENNFKVFTGTNTAGLQQMLNLKRIDYFPRSILEIWQEHAITKYPDLAIDQHIVIHYPAAVYFFVSKNNTTLHQKITAGLEIAINNGQFDAIFSEHFGGMIEKADLKNRQYFFIANPLINDPEYLQRKQLWFSTPFAHKKQNSLSPNTDHEDF